MMNEVAERTVPAEYMDSFREKAGAYVHIPFCSAICPYCDFAVVAGREDSASRYVDAVVAEISRDESWRPLNSVYFGGGTPSRVPGEMLGRILQALQGSHGFAQGAELSLEANPEDFTGQTADALIVTGFNRVSFGAQSFDPDVLLALGRRHGPDQIARSVATARRSGFENISIDLIYGTPGETAQSWLSTVERGLALLPDHVSCYALTVEPGTPLGRQVRAGAPSPDPDIQAARSEVVDDILTSAGLVRYEVSNWARSGYECVYNATVWAQGEYLAYGNGSHRYRNGVRSRNIRRLDAYLAAIESTSSPLAGQEVISGWDAEIDRLFVGLRRSAGVEKGVGGEALVGSIEGKRLIEAGLLSDQGGRLTIQSPMLADVVLRAVVGLAAPRVTEEDLNVDNLYPGE